MEVRVVQTWTSVFFKHRREIYISLYENNNGFIVYKRKVLFMLILGLVALMGLYINLNIVERKDADHR